ncbi:hypothetical protein ACF0H5_024575 [Mactra antiquata]
MAKRGKKYRQAVDVVERERLYPLAEALELVVKLSYAKFDETVEAAVHLGIPKGQSVRDTLIFPRQFKAAKRVMVFAQGEKVQEALSAGATYAGGSEFVEKIRAGWLDFDICVATPDMMREVGKLGQILGRRGLMPNPKSRTVTTDLAGVLAEVQRGRAEFRSDKTGGVHLAVGKVSLGADAIAENVAVMMDELRRKKPAAAKGRYFESLVLSSTMGPGVPVDLAQFEV